MSYSKLHLCQFPNKLSIYTTRGGSYSFLRHKEHRKWNVYMTFFSASAPIVLSNGLLDDNIKRKIIVDEFNRLMETTKGYKYFNDLYTDALDRMINGEKFQLLENILK